MTGAQILALAGLLSAAATMLGGWLHVPMLIGAAGAIMLIGNAAVLISGWRSRARAVRSCDGIRVLDDA